MRLSSPFRGANDALARLVDGLSDPARARRAALVFALCYAALWAVYGIVAKSSQDVHADTAEMIVWMREPALGFPKHPPFPAWMLWLWFRVVPLADWSLMLFAALNMAAAIYFAFALCGEWLDGPKRAVVPFLLGAIPFYNFLAFKYDANAATLPLWPLAMWAFVRSLRTRHLGWAALAGFAAAAAMLSKYWSAFLLVALLVAALSDRRRAAYFRSAAPWVTAGVFLLAIAPHIYWLVHENFPPMRWVSTRRVAASLGDLVGSLAEYVGGTIGYAGGAILLVAIVVRPSLPGLVDGFFPRDERRTAAALFWPPLILPMLAAVVTWVRLLSLWSMSSLNLLPVMMLGSPRVAVSRDAALRVAAMVTAITVLIAAASPVIAYAILKQGVENDAAYARLAMQAAEREWRGVTDKPLTLIAGPFVLVSSAAFYGTDKPSTYADFSPYLSPWVDDARIARDGMIVMVATDNPWFDFTVQHIDAYPSARRSEVTLTRRWLWFDSAPKRFVLAIVPPR
jgi:4-amino-4-deoxy-L-arabinose transferase-like glycosyltransferase